MTGLLNQKNANCKNKMVDVINPINMGLSSHHVLHGGDVDVALLYASRGQLRCENQRVAGHHNVTWEDWGSFKQNVVLFTNYQSLLERQEESCSEDLSLTVSSDMELGCT